METVKYKARFNFLLHLNCSLYWNRYRASNEFGPWLLFSIFLKTQRYHWHRGFFSTFLCFFTSWKNDQNTVNLYTKQIYTKQKTRHSIDTKTSTKNGVFFDSPYKKYYIATRSPKSGIELNPHLRMKCWEVQSQICPKRS